MSTHLNPLDQLYLINHELMKHGDDFNFPIVTVGGQAVHYWVVWYLDNYETPPPGQYITSNDIDVTARRLDIQAIAKALDVPAEYNDGNPPSLAILPLTNAKNGSIKSYQNKLFVNKQIFDAENIERPNIVDILSSASDLEPKDFEGKKLLLHTEIFYLPLDGFQYTPHKNIRVLNPIACMASRFHNVTTGVKKNIAQEVERIKALMVPVVAYILGKFAETDFRVARKYYDLFIMKIEKSAYRRFIVTHNISIIKMLDIIRSELIGSGKFNGSNKQFVLDEIPRTIKRIEEKLARKEAQIFREKMAIKHSH